MTEKKAVQYAWVGWGMLFLAAAVVIVLNGHRSTMPIYRYAALAWVQGQRMYELSGIGGFTYFPQAAILLVPFSVLPVALGEVAWRLVSVAVFAFAFRELAGLLRERAGKNFFPLMTLVAIPMIWDCARNGQATLLMAALMLLAVTDVARNRWWLATLWLCLAVSVKPLAIVLILLVMAVDRAMSWRLALGLLVTALVPFLTQHPAYVVEQYRACFHNMTTAAHVGVIAHGWTTPFTALRVWGFDVPEKVQTLIRLGAALGTLGLCFFVRRRYDPARSALFVYSLAALYVILFSPRTENNTYAMLGPVAGYFVANAVLLKHRIAEGALLGCMALVMVSSRIFEQMLAPGRERIWLSPLLASVLAVYAIAQIVSRTEHDGTA